MGFEITPKGAAPVLRVFIDYSLPGTPLARWFGGLLAAAARWCTASMADDAAKHFA